MKLIGALKEAVEQAQSLEEVKRVIEQAGMELSDEELKEIAGGRSIPKSFFTDRILDPSNAMGRNI
ncbi:hypothetical protein D6855_09790 [Butyrivibrio sp. CB08]|uniref:hypothetical protein n=1 Tax=Butyrivibrio sp. CB08 TaxID=2364879 RepID=UPI000EAA3A05|nr:hypothetical protein [Butyrivibrio sp. CB08]RKM59189.1 hypothetical protein D6855_09790 [Butyrivibrio sp. CB08]